MHAVIPTKYHKYPSITMLVSRDFGIREGASGDENPVGVAGGRDGRRINTLRATGEWYVGEVDRNW